MDTSSQKQIERLIVSAQQGDNSALGRVLQAFHAYLKLLARLRLDHRLSEKVSDSDIVQETFMSAQKAFRQFRGNSERELMAWLRTILSNEIAAQARYYRRDRRAVAMERRLQEDLDRTSAVVIRQLADRGASPSAAAESREAEIMVAEALAVLSDDHREVIILHSFQQKPFSAVAIQMGRTEAAVKSLWVRALANLRRAMVRQHEQAFLDEE